MLGPQHYLALAHRPHASGTLQAAPCLSAPCKRPLECGTLFSCTCAICRRHLANAARASGTLYRVRRCKRPAWNGHPFLAPYRTLQAATAPAAPCRRHPAHAATILAPPLCLRRPAPHQLDLRRPPTAATAYAAPCRRLATSAAACRRQATSAETCRRQPASAAVCRRQPASAATAPAAP